ncbi:PQQ-binding-like beta-propeller repeat protein [Mycobacterium adipatum]|uniref:outer membrane protein assembly factor BamB family protein n=1 Tax=Mycobacterium adipatum TaxID=1682113 RepID=UPI0018D2F4E5|nr:PQQ-binding-like beta-propeller repeat protein [Mycobacterium adipatum]
MAGGLAAATCVCTALAWAGREPSLPLLADRADVAWVLWRSTAIVAVMLVVSTGYVLLMRMSAEGRASDFAQRRAWLLRHLSLPLGVLGCAGIWMRLRESARERFDDASAQQASLDGLDAVGFASVAWICACLVVWAWAAVALLGAPQAAASIRAARALVSVLTVLAVGGVAVLVVHHPAVHSTTGEGAVPPAAAVVDFGGPVAYELPADSYPEAITVAGGPGLLRSSGAGAYPDGVVGISGSSGKQMWSFTVRDLLVHDIAVSSGADPVAVLSATYLGHTVLIGFNAADGQPLWTRPGGGSLRQEGYQDLEISADRFVSTRPHRLTPTGAPRGREWTVRDVRTGAALWSVIRMSDCFRTPDMTENYVLAAECDGTPRIGVFDAQTGDETATLTDTKLGASAMTEHQLFAWPIPESDLALVWLNEPDGVDIHSAAIIDVATGAVVQRLPSVAGVSVAAAGAVMLQDRQGRRTILDTDTGDTIDVGSNTSDMRFVEEFGSAWARIDDRWVTVAPTAGQVAPTINVFTPDAPVASYPNPCPGGSAIPAVAAVSGALLVNCGDRIVGIR